MEHTTHKKLYRSDTDKVFAGICGGLGEYFNVDPVVVRLVWLVILFTSGGFPGLAAYGLAIIMIPRKAATAPVHTHHTEKTEKENA